MIPNSALYTESSSYGILLRSAFGEGLYRMTSCAYFAMIAYLSPVFESVLACLVLILIDAYYGYRVSCKYGVKEIDSSKIRKTLRKLVEAVIGISCAHMVDASIIVSFDAHLTEIVSGVIAGTESLSILESLIELDPAGPWGRLKCILRAKGQKYSDIEFPKSKNSTNE